MTKIYDVIIVGAGPAGTSCGYNLKRFNPQLSVLVLDKAEFPRYKPCGGGISPEVFNYFDFDLDEAINYRCRDVVMVANGRHYHSDKHELLMVRREVFDNFLLAKAQARGIEFKQNCMVSGVTERAEYSELETNQGQFLAKIVVIAEGGRGNLAKKLGIAPKNTVLAAMEYEHYTPQSGASADGRLYIDFDYNDSGYAWNFPKQDGLSLGICGLLKGRAKGKVALPQKLKHYTQQFGVEQLDKRHLHGHPIQLYSGRKKLVHSRTLLIGEVAGCVDPLTAEGIRPAIKSAYLAAKTIVKALECGQYQLLHGYDRKFHQQIGKDFQVARIISYFLNRHLTKFLPTISSVAAIDGFMSVFSGKSTYREKINWRRMLSLLGKIIRK